MISFEEYKDVYHSNVKDETEINHIKVEFESNLEALEKLNPEKDYSTEELRELLFDKQVKSQTTFYRRRRGMVRLATIMGFNFKIVHKINSIDFEDVFDNDSFASEYFASLDDLCDAVLKVQKASPENDRTGSLAAVCLLWSGLTFAEVTRLKDADIDFSSNTITYEDANKNKRQIVIGLRTANAIKAYMDSRKSTDGYLFVGATGMKAHTTTINKMVVNMSKFSDRKFISKNITYSGWFWRIYNGREPEDFSAKDLKMKYETWVECFYG